MRSAPLLLAATALLHLLLPPCARAQDLHALPPHLSEQQQLEVAQARAAMEEALTRPPPPLQAITLDAHGQPVPAPPAGAPAHDPAAAAAAAPADSPLALAYTTDLLMGAMSGSLPAVEAALAQGARLSAADAFGRAPLALAAINGRVELVRELLRLGAAREARDASGRTAAELAAQLRAESLEEGDAPRAAQLALVEEALAARLPSALAS
jgi:hypothetical protein